MDALGESEAALELGTSLNTWMVSAQPSNFTATY